MAFMCDADEMVTAINAEKGGNGKNIRFHFGRGTIAVLKALSVTTINGEDVVYVLLNCTKNGLCCMKHAGYLHDNKAPGCTIRVKVSIFETDAEFSRWLKNYDSPENKRAILSNVNCIGNISL